VRTLTPKAGPDPGKSPSLTRLEDAFLGRFTAMASPCEVLIDTDDREEAEAMVAVAAAEALRVEAKFSRYRTDNLVHRINHAGGDPVRVDEETAHLIDYAATCHDVSNGMFDITSGALRRVWTFDGGSRIPTDGAVDEALRHVGWHRVAWRDRAAGLIAARTGCAHLVNFGGDLFASGPRRGGRPWIVGVDDPDRTGEAALFRIELTRGGLATTGDARRYVLWKGRRLGHILNPKTGWPVDAPPRAITVLGRTCLEAGTLSTLAYLQGPGAQDFLREQGVDFRIV
jgi:thiamine biosynthesis lipoprotein